MKNNGRIRVFTHFIDNGFEKPHWEMNLMVHSSPYTNKKDKLMLFEIASLAKSALYSVDHRIVSVDFNRYGSVTKLMFLCELQRYAQDKGYTIDFDPLQY